MFLHVVARRNTILKKDDLSEIAAVLAEMRRPEEVRDWLLALLTPCERGRLCLRGGVWFVCSQTVCRNAKSPSVWESACVKSPAARGNSNVALFCSAKWWNAGRDDGGKMYQKNK